MRGMTNNEVAPGSRYTTFNANTSIEVDCNGLERRHGNRCNGHE